ncbi:MAG: hypothetical protein AAF703_05805 [Cyanobacteria bacterium P01_D01_bin.105]
MPFYEVWLSVDWMERCGLFTEAGWCVKENQRMTLSRMNVWKVKRRSPATLFERIMAAIALINLICVLFDLSYIRFRDTYLKLMPAPTVRYGETFKGIEPERTTVRYLQLVDSFAAQTDDDEASARRLLAQLRAESVAMVDEDPFAVANKSGTLARIKNEMRDRMETESSKAAFRQFWSTSHLTPERLDEELAFFDGTIRPLMETNYFRGIGETGNPIDLFWRIDIWFMGLFAAEFLLRTFVLSRRHPNTTWLDAMLWRIYDVPLFIGLWRWLRFIPVTLRLHQARWLNLEPVRNRASRALVSQFAVELTEIVMLRVIDQAQQFVRQGDINRWLIAATDRSQYVDINGVDEVQTITQRLSDIVAYRVLPKVKPEIDALLQHSVVGALQQAPAYQGLKFMPGFNDLSAQISHQVVAELSKNLVGALQTVVSDEKGAKLTSDLIAKFGDHLRLEIQSADTMSELRELICDLLEEIKINYVEGIAQEDLDQMQAARYRLYGETQRGR